MSINSRLKIAAVTSAVVALAVGGAVLMSYEGTRAAQKKDRAVQDVISGMNELNSLASYYLLYHEERPRQQFLAVNDDVVVRLRSERFGSGEQEQIVSGIHADVEAMKGLFAAMVSTHQRRLGGGDGAVLREAEERLAGQLLLKQREAVADGLRLQRLVGEEAASRHQILGLLAFGLLIGLACPLVAILAITTRRIAASLGLLRQGTLAIGSGALTHRIALPGKDELADLAGAFDGMTEKLEAVTVSKARLQSEVEERKRVEESLRRAKEDWERTFDSVPDLIALLDEEHRIIRMNRAMAQRLGCQPKDCVGLRCYEAVHGLKAPPAFCPHTQTLCDGGEHHVELHEDRLGGDFIVSTTPFEGPQGKPAGTVHVARDITVRKRAEEEQVRNMALLEAVFTAMTDGVVVYDNDAQIVRTNAAARSIYGIDPIRKDVMTLSQHLSARRLDGRPIVREELPTPRALRGERVIGERYVLRNASGLEVIVESSSTPLRIDDRIVGAVTAWHEITDLVRAQEALVQADRRKNDFLAILSHELRNPLAPIKNSLYVLDRAAPGGDQARRAKAIIDRQVGQLVHLVDDLLDVTRINRNKIQLQRRRLELNALVLRTLEDHRSLFDKIEIRSEFNPAPGPVFIDADWNRLAQMVGNLLQNAGKFTGRGGCVSVSVVTEPPEGRAIVRIADTGVGMAPETLARLFQPFVQADVTLDRSKGGLGLGLALVKGVVELHGGDVAARSEGLGKGSEFVVRLPLAKQEAGEPRVCPAPERGGAKRVLIIEDNVDAAQSLREMLEFGEHEVAVVFNGPDGIAKAREFRPDVVLCDIGLPGMDGYDVARAFRADDELRNTFLVALSGYAMPEDLRRAQDAGFQRHMAKPPSIEKLEEILAGARS